MDRRDFFSLTVGGLILGPVMGPTALRYHTPTKTIRKVRVWSLSLIPDDPNDNRVLRKLMPVVGEDAEGIMEKFRLECSIEDVDDDPRHCVYCGQYPCDCWRDV